MAAREVASRNGVSEALPFVSQCGQPFVQGDQEFVQVQIKGQSFMLHQIRKMVGLVIAIMRGCTKETTIRRAWGPEKVSLTANLLIFFFVFPAG